MSGAKEHGQKQAGPNRADPVRLSELPAETGVEVHGELRVGDLCPRCGKARLDYDGLLNLACPECGYTSGGCFT